MGVNWQPIDELKLTANVGLLKISDAPFYRNPAGNDTVDVAALRAQIDW